MIIELFLWALLIIFSPAIIVCAFLTLAIVLIFFVFVLYCLYAFVAAVIEFIFKWLKRPFTKKKNDIEL